MTATTPTITVSFTSTVAATITERDVSSTTTTAATATVTETSTTTERVASTTVTTTVTTTPHASPCPSSMTSPCVADLFTEPPSTCNELVAVAVVASFFILVAFSLGVILAVVMVKYVRVHQSRYGRTESGEVYANNGQAG